jgi:transposase
MADARDEDGVRHQSPLGCPASARIERLTCTGRASPSASIRERLGRGRSWLAKWLRRYREEGWAGLRSRSRAPRQQWQRTPEPVVARIVAIRLTLEQRRTRRSRFAGTGAEVVHLELQHQRVRSLPSLSTIERILRRHGYPKQRPRRRNGGGEPYPAPRARRLGDLQQPTWWAAAISAAPEGSLGSIR